jgi:zinc transport system permease protein
LALVAALAGAITVELIRARGEAFADIALAMLFYGGLAGGVVLVSRAPSGGRNLDQYLFGSITTTSTSDLVVFAILTVIVLALTARARRALYTVSNDEEYARASGVPVLTMNLMLAVVSAMTVVISMRVVGVLLVSALMVVPVATAQLVARSFRGTYVLSIALGAVVSVAGVAASYELDLPSGGTIVLLAIAVFAVALIVNAFGALIR